MKQKNRVGHSNRIEHTDIISLLFFILAALSYVSVLSHSAVAAGNCAHAVICGNTFECGIIDYVCPEDFSDSAGVAPNCSINDCIDADCGCAANVSGIVYNVYESPIEGAVVTTHPAGKPEGSSPTGSGGAYTILDTYGGYYYISVSATGYDTWSELKQVVCGNNNFDFTLPDGSCHPDCSNSEGRCDPLCDGAYFPNEPGHDKTCTFFDDGGTAKSVCDQRLVGTVVQYDSTSTIRCCEGEPEPYQPSQGDLTSEIRNIVKHTIVTRLFGSPVKVTLLVWKP